MQDRLGNDGIYMLYQGILILSCVILLKQLKDGFFLGNEKRFILG